MDEYDCPLPQDLLNEMSIDKLFDDDYLQRVKAYVKNHIAEESAKKKESFNLLSEILSTFDDLQRVEIALNELCYHYKVDAQSLIHGERFGGWFFYGIIYDRNTALFCKVMQQ